jgi:hypothetical protein
MRAALALGAAVDVVPALTDRFLDVTAIGLARLEAPDLLVGTLQETAQCQAVLTTAADACLAPPVGGRRQVSTTPWKWAGWKRRFDAIYPRIFPRKGATGGLCGVDCRGVLKRITLQSALGVRRRSIPRTRC